MWCCCLPDHVDQRAEQICIIYNLTCSWICWSIKILSIYLSSPGLLTTYWRTCKFCVTYLLYMGLYTYDSYKPYLQRRRSAWDVYSYNSLLRIVRCAIATINAQRASFRSLVAAESTLQRPMHPARDHSSVFLSAWQGPCGVARHRWPCVAWHATDGPLVWDATDGPLVWDATDGPCGVARHRWPLWYGTQQMALLYGTPQMALLYGTPQMALLYGSCHTSGMGE